jgi:hypothetical protein
MADVRARWDDVGNLVFYQETCQFCEHPEINSVPNRENINDLAATTAKIKSAFLLRIR